jgi:hypothetical protein
MRSLWIVAVGSVICGCGGGSGGGSTTAPVTTAAPAPAPAPPPAASADFSGIWVGTLTHATGLVADVIALTTASGRFALVAVDTVGPETLSQYAGVATVAGQQITGTGTVYAAPSPVFPGGSAVLPITLELTLAARQTLSGRVRSGNVLDARLDLAYDRSMHEHASSLTKLAGIWYVYDEMLSPMITFTIELDGRFLGQSRNGCQSSGQVSLIDARYNVYAWDATIQTCPAGGSYTGLGTLVDADSPTPSAFLATIASGTSAILLPLER